METQFVLIVDQEVWLVDSFINCHTAGSFVSGRKVMIRRATSDDVRDYRRAQLVGELLDIMECAEAALDALYPDEEWHELQREIQEEEAREEAELLETERALERRVQWFDDFYKVRA